MSADCRACELLHRRREFTWLIWVEYGRSLRATDKSKQKIYLVPQHDELCHASWRAGLPYWVTYTSRQPVSAQRIPMSQKSYRPTGRHKHKPCLMSVEELIACHGGPYRGEEQAAKGESGEDGEDEHGEHDAPRGACAALCRSTHSEQRLENERRRGERGGPATTRVVIILMATNLDSPDPIGLIGVYGQTVKVLLAGKGKFCSL